MNTNTVAGFFNGSARNQFPTQTVVTTTATAFQINADAGAVTGVLAMPGQSQILGSQSPLDVAANPATSNGGFTRISYFGDSNPPYNSGVFDGRPFKVRLSGVGNAGANAAQSVLVSLTLGTSSTIGSNSVFATTGAALATVAGGAFKFLIEATCFWDSTTGFVSGLYHSAIDFTNKAGSQVVTEAQLLLYPTAAAVANLNFVGFLTLGNGASSTVTVKDFSIEQV